MKLTSLIAALAIGTNSLSLAANEVQPILSKRASGNSGFVINAGGWNETNNLHADDAYRAFKKYKKEELGQYDFYYQLVVARQNSPTKGNWCDNGLDVGQFLKGVFGVSQGALATLKLNLNYVYDAGQKVGYFGADPAPIIMLGVGQAAGAVTPGNGCYFQLTPAFQSPLYRFNGGGADQDYFTFDFSVSGGRAVTLNAVSIVFGLFDKFNAAYNFATIKAGNEAAVQAASNSFQTAMTNALTSAGTASANYTMGVSDKFHQRIAMSIPELFGKKAPPDGNLVFYIRRSASIFLDTSQKKLTPTAILSNDRVALRGCGIDATAKGTCTSVKSLSSALFEAAKTVVDKPSVDIYDLKTSGTRGNVLNLCKIVRQRLRDTFRLSVIDEMLVRWALVKQSRLYDTLFDQTKLDALAKETNENTKDYLGACYNGGDEEVLNAILSDPKVKIVRSDEL